MMSLSDDKKADVIDAFNTTSRYLDDILNINNVYFDNMISQIYPSETQSSNLIKPIPLIQKPHFDDFLLIVTPIVGFCNCSMFCCALLYFPSSFAIILMGRKSWLLCLVCLPGVS